MTALSAGSLRRAIDRKAIEAAIARIHSETTGEVRVMISPFFWGSVRKRARRAFRVLGLPRARQKTGVLIFLVPRRREVVILGDAGIHGRTSEDLWREARDRLTSAFARGRYTEGIVEAIATIGRELAVHFPAPGLPTA